MRYNKDAIREMDRTERKRKGWYRCTLQKKHHSRMKRPRFHPKLRVFQRSKSWGYAGTAWQNLNPPLSVKGRKTNRLQRWIFLYTIARGVLQASYHPSSSSGFITLSNGKTQKDGTWQRNQESFFGERKSDPSWAQENVQPCPFSSGGRSGWTEKRITINSC